MSAASPRYRFATEPQWTRCLATALGETLILEQGKGEQVAAALPAGVRAFAAAPDGELFWVDLAGRLTAGGCIGPELGRVRRLVAGSNRLWARTAESVLQTDRRSLQLLLTLDVSGLGDIAAAGGEGLWLLRKRRVWRIDAAGRSMSRGFLLSERAIGLAAADGRLAVLAHGGGRLALIEASDGHSLVIDLDSLVAADETQKGEAAQGGFTAARITGGRDRFLLQGRWQDGAAGYLLLDTDGSIAARARWSGGTAPFGLALSGADLLAAFGPRRAPELRRFATMAQAGGEVRLTPALDTETLSGGWQRAEVEAWLPESATLAMRWAATSDEGLRATVERAAADPNSADGAKLERIGQLLDGCWSRPFTYVGEADGGHAAERFTFPIDAPGQPIAWVELRLMRNGAAAPPRFGALDVLHDGPNLIDHLPAIYRGRGDGDGTMRRLTGVIEATTQDIDARIASLARRLDPERTDAAWLPGLAAMLGLPFDAALEVPMQRRLIGAAPEILAGRGARRGLVALVGALFPGRSVEVVDRTQQLTAIALGGSGFAGDRLPALLAGPSPRVPRLSARLVLGRTALCPTDPCDEGLVAPSPEVAVSIPASGRERHRYDAALRQMLAAMIPAGVRLRLRWIERNGAARAGSTSLPTPIGSPRPLRIGESGPLGAVRIGGRTEPRLDGEGTTPVRHRLL
ncbi:MAG: hypothetical protein JWO81_2753 [Alphaproteobacteria bacterium]|nr:hypothetical protein [Alphaproteobacteria bacterium]